MNSSELLQALVGEWSGTGVGQYPTIQPFEYIEILRFEADLPRPTLHYEQRTRHRHPGNPQYDTSHWESGFLRAVSDIELELTNAQNAGRVEVLKGSIQPTTAGCVFHLHSALFGNDPRMKETHRIFTLEGDALHYTSKMQINDVPLVLHVEANLRRGNSGAA